MRKKSDKKTAGLSFDFNRAAKQAAKDHPALKGTLFVNAANDDWPNLAAALADLSVEEEDINELGKTVRTAKRLRTSFHQSIDRGTKKPLSVVVFHPDRHPLFGAKRGNVDDTGTFDHETGHALAPDTDGNRGENLADAYAAIRHVQRFGDATEDLDYCAWKRAMVFMQTGVTSHLTTFTVDRIIIDRKTADFVSLTPKETEAIAKAYAKKNAPNEKTLEKLQKDFGPLKGLSPQAAFRKLGKITLKAKTDSPTFYLGMRILSGALKDEGTALDGERIALKGAEWDTLRDKLSRKIARLPARHPLRRLGLE